jgi:predicted transcriptional regulator
MVDQLLHEQLQQTNNYKELCAHMSRRDKVLFKATTTKLENVKGMLKHAIDAMEVYKKLVDQLVIEIKKKKQSVQQCYPDGEGEAMDIA